MARGTKWADRPFSEYTIHNIALAEGGYNYYQYIHSFGQAVIMREKEDETEYLYAKAGFKTFDASWTGRADLSYTTYDKLDIA